MSNGEAAAKRNLFLLLITNLLNIHQPPPEFFAPDYGFWEEKINYRNKSKSFWWALVCFLDSKPCSVVDQIMPYLLYLLSSAAWVQGISDFSVHKKKSLTLSGTSNTSLLTCQEHGSSAIQAKLSNVRKRYLLVPDASKASCVVYPTILLFKCHFIRRDSFQPSKAVSTGVNLSNYCREDNPVVNNHTEEKCSSVNRIKLTNNCLLQALSQDLSPSLFRVIHTAL